MNIQRIRETSEPIVLHLLEMGEELQKLAAHACKIHGDEAAVFVIQDCPFWKDIIDKITGIGSPQILIPEIPSPNGYFVGISDWTICALAQEKSEDINDDDLTDGPAFTIPMMVFFTSWEGPLVQPMHLIIPDSFFTH